MLVILQTSCGTSEPPPITRAPAALCAGTAGGSWQQARPTPFGVVLARGHSTGFLALSANGGGALLAKVDDNGQAVWSAPVAGAPHALTAIGEDSALAATGIDGPPLAPGVRYADRPRQQVLVARVDAPGSVDWQTTVGDDEGDLVASFVSPTGQGDYLVAGHFLADLKPTDFPNPPYREGGFVAKLSADGNLLWVRHFGDRPTVPRGFIVDSSGQPGVIVSMSSVVTIDGLEFPPSDAANPGVLVLFDENGKAVEARPVAQGAAALFDRATVDDSGRLFVAGSLLHDGLTFTSELFVSAFDPQGTRLWTASFSPAPQSAEANIVVDPCGDVLLVGNGGDGFLAARLSRDGIVKAQTIVPSSIGASVREVAPAPGGIFAAGAARDNNRTGFLARIPL